MDSLPHLVNMSQISQVETDNENKETGGISRETVDRPKDMTTKQLNDGTSDKTVDRSNELIINNSKESGLPVIPFIVHDPKIYAVNLVTKDSYMPCTLSDNRDCTKKMVQETLSLSGPGCWTLEEMRELTISYVFSVKMGPTWMTIFQVRLTLKQ